MSFNQESKLSLLPFPQRWENGSLILNAIVLPRGNPLSPLMRNIDPSLDGPAFADANLRLKARLVSGLEKLPSPEDDALEIELELNTPQNMRGLYGLLGDLTRVDTSKDHLTKDQGINAAKKPPKKTPIKNRKINKLLVSSYCNSFAFSGPRAPGAVTDEGYACAIMARSKTGRKPDPHPLSPWRPVWGNVIAMALRQPALAERLGLLYSKIRIVLANESLFKNGGWIYLDLLDSSDFAKQVSSNPQLLARYAARIPKLGNISRNLFAAVLFPVSSSSLPGDFHELFAEAASYDDGFAKIVHCAQQTTADLVGLEKKNSSPAFTDTGVMLGWDDEQILIWLNRQIADPSNELRNSPMGVLGYRVDVREKVGPGENPNRWSSLMRARAESIISKRPFKLNKLNQPPNKIELISKIKFNGELTVEAKPVQLDNNDTGDYWLPTYFTQWKGQSLVVADEMGISSFNMVKDEIETPYRSIGGDDVPLRYGRRYEFRVRLADISGGGPEPDLSSSGLESASQPFNPAPAPIAECHFRRHIKPREVRIIGLMDLFSESKDLPGSSFRKANLPKTIEIYRPRLAYPAAVFTGISNAQDLLFKDRDKILNRVSKKGNDDTKPYDMDLRHPTIPDPDVDSLEICVQVVSPELDPANDYTGHPPLRNIYTMNLNFPTELDKPITLQLTSSDDAGIYDKQIDDFKKQITEISEKNDDFPIVVPTDRDVVVTFKPLCGKGLEYLSEDAKIGRPADIRLRCNSKDKSDFFIEDPRNLRAIFLQQDEATTPIQLAMLKAMGKGNEAETDIMTRLAAELGLTLNGMTLSGRPGRRIIFGCSSAIPHIIGPDQSTITFSSKADLVLRWISVINVKVNRDWTWSMTKEDGTKQEPAIIFKRLVKDKDDNKIITQYKKVGEVRLPMIVNPGVFSVSANLIDGDDNIDRKFTDIFFFDAVDPHPGPGEYPQEKKLYYTLIPQFSDLDLLGNILTQEEMLAQKIILQPKITLPIAVPPNQIPKLVSAGVALSPYLKANDYSSTEVPQRMLWLEFAEEPENPDDTFFARVLFNAPDPILTGLKEISQPIAAPLPIDPEHMKVIYSVSSDDRAGMGAMQPLIPASGYHNRRIFFLLPMPPGLHESSRELFGFFDYELRVGHLKGWSTARARFGPALNVAGVQHPAPPLHCSVSKTADSLQVSASYAVPIFNGRNMMPSPPRTQLWMLLYTQVSQADGNGFRNLLLDRQLAQLDENSFKEKGLLVGIAEWMRNKKIDSLLKAHNLPKSNPLSVMAVELLPDLEPPKDPLGNDLGKVRILRTSNLVKVGKTCLDNALGNG